MRRTLRIRQPLPFRVGLLLGFVGCAVFLPRLNAADLPQTEPIPTHASRTTVAPTPSPTVLTLEMRGDIYMARKSYEDAVDYYYRALRQTGFSNAALWNKMGIAYQEEANLRSARKAYQRAIHDQRTFAAAWNNVGTTYYLSGNDKKAIKYYQHAITLEPNNASFHLNLGTAFYHRRKYQKTVEQYRQALMLDPNILIQNSKTGTIIEARGSDVEYYFYMAKVFASLGRNSEAIRYLRHALEDGFHNYRRLDSDPDFAKLKTDPAYIALLKNPPMAIKD
ncbi:MAG: tetratricopeptide repeat protein [Terriglobia bacterium]